MSRPLRVALVHPFSWPDVRRGAERYLHDLADWLGGAGHSVDVITGRSRTGQPPSSTDGVRFRTVRRPGALRLGRWDLTSMETFGVTALVPLLRRRYDVVHALTPTATLAARLAGHRVVFTLLGHPERRHFEHHVTERRLTRAAVRAATIVVALSRASASAAHELFGREPDVLSPGVWTDRFPRKPRPTGEPPRILFSADASDRRKGVDLALVALGRLLERRPDARLLLGGPGDHTWALERLGADRERIVASTDVLGTGTLDDVPRRYREATLTLLPSNAEAFGLVLVESLASGTPVVCSAAGGMPEIVADADVGRAVPHGDVDALVEGLEEVVDLEARAGTAERCSRHAQQWGWAETVGPRHEGVYRSITRSARRRSASSP